MAPLRGKLTVVFVALLLCGAAATAAEPFITKGQSLAAALDSLRAQGLQLIFSSALIAPDAQVDVDPGAGSAEEIARRILAPHGLTLEPVRAGLFAVVKAPVDKESRSAALGEARTAAGARPADDALAEIDIYASRYKIEPQATTAALAELSREDIASLPGINQDALRVTRFLPGTAANALSARSHVRGGRDDELAVYFDGVPLFEPFHYKDVQSFLGILDPESISTIDFFSGVFPVRYGNRLSGVLDIQPRTWSGNTYNALGASVLYTHALSQGRLSSQPVEWLASVRRSNVDMFADLVGHQEMEPDFLDALGRVQFDLTPRMSLVGGWLLLDDELSVNFDDGRESGDVAYRDATGWLSWRFKPSDSSELHATVSRTERHTDREGLVNQRVGTRGSLDDRRVFNTTTARVEGTTRLRDWVTLSAGLEWYDYSADYRYLAQSAFDASVAAAFGRDPGFARDITLRSTGNAYATYGSATFDVARNTKLDIALRWDAQRFGRDFHDEQISPRVSLQYDYDPTTTLRLSWGRAAQAARPDELQVADGDATYPAAQRATQIAASAERHVTPTTLVRVEAYNKRVSNPSPSYENLLDPFALFPELEVDRVRVAPDRSLMYGAELSVRWQLPQDWSGWASYTWSEATDHFGPVSVLRTWDQKHAVATGLSWNQHPWVLAANVSWHSGWRRNDLEITPTGIGLDARNADHWPPYFSLDVRAGWSHSLPKGSLEAFFEVDNLTNHSNPCCSEYRLGTADVAPLSREETSWLPRLFLLGVTWQLP